MELNHLEALLGLCWEKEEEGRQFQSSPPLLSSRALADILRQQGPVPVSQYEHEDMAVMDGSPKDETPVRTSKNHYTPVHKASNHGRKLIYNSKLEISSVSSTET